MPSFSKTALLLRKTTERLAQEIAQPSSAAPEWSDLEWVFARAAAVMQGTSALLANRLLWPGPEGWRSFLNEQRQQSVLRHDAIDALLSRLDVEFRAAGCAAVALKGAAILNLQIYRRGERPMGDVDLLIRSQDAAAAAEAIGRSGYVLAFSKYRHEVFEPRYSRPAAAFGEHPDSPLKVEVHTHISESLPVLEVDITDELLSDELQPGLNGYPGMVELLLHSVLHAAGNMRANAARQIQFSDIAALAQNMRPADWSRLLSVPANSNRRRWWVYPPLALAERYFSGSVPEEVLREARAACPRMLRAWVDRRSLTDISWSNIRIQAFPGLVWSRNPGDMVRYMHSRIVPGQTALKELAEQVRHNPRMQSVPWYGLSHVSRIFRWLLSRPPRVQTYLSLSAALDSANVASGR